MANTGQNNQKPEVKVEEKEIDEMARKIIEKNKKAAVLQITADSPSSTNNENSVVQHAPALCFGWEEICAGVAPIPYILRGNVKLVSIKIFNNTIGCRYSQFLNKEVLDCMPPTFIVPNREEIDLLNEINMKHSDYFFGKGLFTMRDVFQTLEDCIKRYNFLQFCYLTLMNTIRGNVNHGFVSIDKQHLVPYVVYNNKKHVPIFYFEGEGSYLDKVAVSLRGWELSYMRFLCKVQQIKKSLYEGESVTVVSLDELVKLFPPNTTFELGWPNNVSPDLLLRVKKLPPGAPNTTIQTIMPSNPNTDVLKPNGILPTVPNGQLMKTNRKLLLTHPTNMQKFIMPQGTPNPAPVVPNGETPKKYLCYVPLIPYQGCVTYISGKKLVGVNMKPHDKSVTMLCVEDIWQKFFMKMPLDRLVTAIGKAGIQVVEPNAGQVRAIKDMAQKKLNNYQKITCIGLKEFTTHYMEISKHVLGSKFY